jgi:hypothetical protein
MVPETVNNANHDKRLIELRVCPLVPIHIHVDHKSEPPIAWMVKGRLASAANDIVIAWEISIFQGHIFATRSAKLLVGW